jgi:hypothetical protein
MVGQGCSLIGFVGVKTLRFDACNRVGCCHEAAGNFVIESQPTPMDFNGNL